jgi:hypothetical protein
MLNTSSNIHTIATIAVPNTSKNIYLNLLVHYMSIIVLKRTFPPAATTQVFQTQNGKYNFQAITTASFLSVT